MSDHEPRPDPAPDHRLRPDRGADDKFRPTKATAEGQVIDLAASLHGAGRKGKVIAWVALLAMLAVGVFLAVSVASSL